VPDKGAGAVVIRARHTGVATAIFVGLLLAACGAGPGGSSVPSGHGRLTVVATTTVFADLVANVGGDLVEVSSLVPSNGDVHTFSPRPSDVRAVATARLLVMNGLGLDDWLQKTIENASAAGTPLMKLAVDLPGVSLLPGETPETQNPHLWLDVAYAQLYVDRIAAALAQVDPGRAADYAQRGAAYRARLDDLDDWVREQVASVPPAARRIVTVHDAFPYFAHAYGITIVGVAVEAPGQDPSAGYTARLIEAIRSADVRVIFSERQFPTRLVEQLAAETGITVVADLYDDALGDPPVTSYEAVMRWNVDAVVGALRADP
jgi:ABC-type Zn uptake system ZnuABC Zn-binding protein ZnuA